MQAVGTGRVPDRRDAPAWRIVERRLHTVGRQTTLRTRHQRDDEPCTHETRRERAPLHHGLRRKHHTLHRRAARATIRPLRRHEPRPDLHANVFRSERRRTRSNRRQHGKQRVVSSRTWWRVPTIAKTASAPQRSHRLKHTVDSIMVNTLRRSDRGTCRSRKRSARPSPSRPLPSCPCHTPRSTRCR